MKDFLPCLAEIMDRCATVSPEESNGPREKVASDEKVVGQLPYELRGLFLARANLLREIAELESQDEIDQDTNAQIIQKKSLDDLMVTILFHEATMNQDLKLWQYEGKISSIRQGWKVVVFSDRRKNEQGPQGEERRASQPYKVPLISVPEIIFIDPNQGSIAG